MSIGLLTFMDTKTLRKESSVIEEFSLASAV